MKRPVDEKVRDLVAHKTGMTPAQVEHVLVEYEEAAEALHAEPEWRGLTHMSGQDFAYGQYVADDTKIVMHIESEKKRGGDWKQMPPIFTFQEVQYSTYGEAREAELRSDERPSGEIIGVTPLNRKQREGQDE